LTRLGTIKGRKSTAMNVTLKPEFEKLIEEHVKSGRLTDPNEFY